MSNSRLNEFNNDQQISEIRFCMNLHNYCPLGDDWYTNQLSVSFIPGEYVPDYVFLDSEIRKLDGKDLIIEDVVQQVYDLVKSIHPKKIEVRSHVSDAKHMTVDVIKRDE